MPTSTVLLIILALFVSIAIGTFQYFHEPKGKLSQNAIFAALRSLTIFALLLLAINPKVRNTEYFTEKPELILAVDNSSSIAELSDTSRVKNFVNKLRKDKEINNRFDVQLYTFGRETGTGKAPDFRENQTNISTIFKDLKSLKRGQRAPTILMTDGNQTVGQEFSYGIAGYEQPVIPVVLGDTAKIKDLAVTRINANKYAFLNNRFPVEVILRYSGKEPAESILRIKSGNTVVFSKKVNFSQSENSAVIQTDLPATSIGTRVYTVEIEPLSEEKNVQNNSRKFALEVIDERTKVAVVYDVLHPDLGALKKTIESNQQREVHLQQIQDGNFDPADYQLLILYQPNSKFLDLFQRLQEKSQNYWLISGPNTDWRFLNAQLEDVEHEITGQTEEVFPVKNDNFGTYQLSEFDISAFPPLVSNFGDLKMESNPDVLFYKKVEGVETGLPLLALLEEKEQKRAFLFGAGIWKWRSQVYQDDSSFESFDEYFGKLVQFLAAQQMRQRFAVSYEPLYNGEQEPLISAEYFDKNYVFDPGKELVLRITNKETGEKRQIPFRLAERHYDVDLSSLPAGEYEFNAYVEGEGLAKTGSFEILSFDMEKQFTGANLEELQMIATQKEQKLYFLEDADQLRNDLLSSNSYLPVQKSRQNNVSLIDWYYLLGIIILLLSLEWFLRKYRGYI
ncbi:vWA domain-containing protein [Salinimicrobium soli]|uniref:vWA domain-containing protein n=1 Tax=Salinimicrobium soli TaxID=1254399 RepID=UPI003AADB3C3